MDCLLNFESYSVALYIYLIQIFIHIDQKHDHDLLLGPFDLPGCGFDISKHGFDL